jgi:hypothetical protein
VSCEALHLTFEFRELLLEPRRLEREGLGRLLSIGRTELTEISCNALFKLCPAPLHLRAGEVPIAVVHGFKFAAVDGNAGSRKQAHLAAQLNEAYIHKANRMGPTFSSKNGVRYRFYVSTALRGRKQIAGSVSRISAPEIENLVEAEVRKKLNADEAALEDVFGRIRHVKMSASKIQIILEGARNDKRPIEIPWAAPTPKGHGHIQIASSETNADPKLLKAIVRAQHWLKHLSNGQSSSLEDLATAAGYNPKVIRQGPRLAFLAPEVAADALDGETQTRLKQIPKSLPLSWREQHRSMN